MLCQTCLGTFRHRRGEIGKDVLAEVARQHSSNNSDTRDSGDSSLPPALDVHMFNHHQLASSLKSAALEGCYICSVAWHKLDVDMQEQLLLADNLDYSTDDTQLFATSCMLMDENFGRMMGIGQFMKDLDGPVWGVQVGVEVSMRLALQTGVQVGYSPLNAFAIRPEQEVQGLDYAGELSPATNSEASWSFVAERFQDCLRNHEMCRAVGNPDRLPTRLICLGCSENSETARLVLSRDAMPEPYLALSHCWGSAQFLKLTRDNLATFQTGIQVSECPTTFRDFFNIARRLEIRYVWIDSLCIIQDDPGDWLHEASQMHEVYTNSLCNICATGSSDSSKGLFITRDPRLFQPCTVDIPWMEEGRRFRILDISLWEAQVLNAPLNKRAWVVQEHLLAPRQLHFGTEQILWECCEMQAAEQYPNGLPPMIANYVPSAFNSQHKIAPEPPEAAARPPTLSLQSKWSNIVQAYTNAKLSYPEDKSMAFAGIVKRFETLLQDEHVAGLWRANIEHHLLWRVDLCRQCDNTPSVRPERYRAPSFSWMSVDGRIFTNGDVKTVDSLAEVSDLAVQHSRGLIVGGSLRIKGGLRPLRLQRTQTPPGPMWFLDRWVRNGQQSVGQWRPAGERAFASMDVDEDYTGNIYGMPVTCETENKVLSGLVLRELGSAAGKFQRVGVFFALSLEATTFLLEHNDDEATYPCEEYDADARKHTISII